eukprot:1192220-Prorocentrum_minimum.AAC.2
MISEGGQGGLVLGGADGLVLSALALELKVVGKELHVATLGEVLAANEVVRESAGAIGHGAGASEVGRGGRSAL